MAASDDHARNGDGDLGIGARAYGTQPKFTVTKAAEATSQDIKEGAICVLNVTPELAAALALPQRDQATNATKMACAAGS